MAAIREELARQVDEAEWGWLRAHLERGGLIIVAQWLALVEAGERIAADDTATIASWITAGAIGKPDAGRLAR